MQTKGVRKTGIMLAGKSSPQRENRASGAMSKVFQDLQGKGSAVNSG